MPAAGPPSAAGAKQPIPLVTGHPLRALEASKHIAPQKKRHAEPRVARYGVECGSCMGGPLGTCSRLGEVALTKVLRLQIEVIVLGHRSCTSTPCSMMGESLDNAFRRSQVAPSAVGHLQDA